MADEQVAPTALVDVVPVAAIVAVGTTGAVLAMSAAVRTSNAFDHHLHLHRGEVGDVVVNPSIVTREADAVIRSLPGVEQATAHTMFLVTADDGQPRSRRLVDEGQEAHPSS